MTKPLMKYVPQKYYSSIRDFYKDSEGYWLCLKADGDYIFENYFSEHTIHENTIYQKTIYRSEKLLTKHLAAIILNFLITNLNNPTESR